MPFLVVKTHPIGYTGEPLYNWTHHRGVLAGDTIPVGDGGLTFTRNPGIGGPDPAVVHLPSATINRLHARLFREDAGFILEDLESRNGTLVNGAPAGRVRLRDGDEIRMAEFVFIYHEASGDSSGTAPGVRGDSDPSSRPGQG